MPWCLDHLQRSSLDNQEELHLPATSGQIPKEIRSFSRYTDVMVVISESYRMLIVKCQWCPCMSSKSFSISIQFLCVCNQNYKKPRWCRMPFWSSFQRDWYEPLFIEGVSLHINSLGSLWFQTDIQICSINRVHVHYKQLYIRNIESWSRLSLYQFIPIKSVWSQVPISFSQSVQTEVLITTSFSNKLRNRLLAPNLG